MRSGQKPGLFQPGKVRSTYGDIAALDHMQCRTLALTGHLGHMFKGNLMRSVHLCAECFAHFPYGVGQTHQLDVLTCDGPDAHIVILNRKRDKGATFFDW
jgi:hypothetical protein